MYVCILVPNLQIRKLNLVRLNAISEGYQLVVEEPGREPSLSKSGLPALPCGTAPSMTLMNRRVQFTFVYVFGARTLYFAMYASLNPYSESYSLKR